MVCISLSPVSRLKITITTNKEIANAGTILFDAY